MRDYRKEVWIASGYACCLPAFGKTQFAMGQPTYHTIQFIAVLHDQVFLSVSFSFSALGMHRTLCANELGDLLQKAEAHNPALQAARERVEQALLKHSEPLEFLILPFAAAGRRRTPRIAVAVQLFVLGSNSFDSRAGRGAHTPRCLCQCRSASRLL